jgi:hypothetical protein
LNRHHRPPDGEISTYNPRPSNSRYGFSRGLAGHQWNGDEVTYFVAPEEFIPTRTGELNATHEPTRPFPTRHRPRSGLPQCVNGVATRRSRIELIATGLQWLSSRRSAQF